MVFPGEFIFNGLLFENRNILIPSKPAYLALMYKSENMTLTQFTEFFDCVTMGLIEIIQ